MAATVPQKLRKTPDGQVVGFPASMSDADIEKVMASQFPVPVSVGEDMAKSGAWSVPKGLAGIVGLPRDAAVALGTGAIYGGNRLFGATPEEASAATQPWVTMSEELASDPGIPGLPLPINAPGKKQVMGEVEKVTGPAYEPQTFPGRVVDTTGQMITGAAVLGAGGPLARLVQGAVPGVSSEIAGEITDNIAPEWGNTARTVTALATGAGANMATAPSSVRSVVVDATRGATRKQLNEALMLMKESNKGGGVPLTYPEAIQHVTGGRTTLDDVARFVENSRHGGPTMRGFFSDRPQFVDSAYNRQANKIDPVRNMPEAVGPAAQKAGQGWIDNINRQINKVTKPLYDAAAPVRINARDMQKILTNPSFKQKVAELRKDPYVGDYYKRIKSNSVEMIDAVKKLMDADGEALKLNPKGIDNFAASAANKQKQEMVDIAKMASSDYEQALTKQADLRGRYLEPVKNGPTGKMADTPELNSQIAAIFPSQPLSGSEAGVTTAIKALSKKDPELAANVVGAHIDKVFQEATQKLQSGANQAGGAKFSAVVAGNEQQMKNLEAAIRSLPNGDSKWVGFKKLLENLQATGRRKPVGSPTDMNQAIRADLQAGGPVGTTVATAASPGNWTTKALDNYRAWRLGKNTAELARLFTDPGAADELVRLSMMKSGTAEFATSVARLMAVTETPREVQDR